MRIGVLAATQVQAFRPDLVARPAANWQEVVALATAGRLVLPMLPPHSLMVFYTLAANLGTPCATTVDELIEADAGTEVYAGTTNLTGQIDIQVTAVAADTTIGKVESLIREAELAKTERQEIIEQLAGYYACPDCLVLVTPIGSRQIIPKTWFSALEYAALHGLLKRKVRPLKGRWWPLLRPLVVSILLLSTWLLWEVPL